MTGLAGAIALLTRVPLPRNAAPNLGNGVAWVAAVGGLIGLLAGCLYAVLLLALSPLVAATLTLATLVLATGALHEDGLADAADAWGGGTTRTETLAILSDPHHGTYAVAALVLLLAMRIGALAGFDPSAAVLLLPVVHAVSRAAAVVMLAGTKPARDHGLAALLRSEMSGRGTVATLVLTTLALTVGLAGVRSLAIFAVAAAVVWAVRTVANRRIGGVTGDVLGATQQLTETALLILLGAWTL